MSFPQDFSGMDIDVENFDDDSDGFPKGDENRPNLRDSNPMVQSSLTFLTTGPSDGFGDDDALLFEIVEHAIAAEDGDYDYEERWNAVREWLLENEDEVDMEEAITSQHFSTYLQDVNGYSYKKLSAMHLVCNHPDPPMDVVQIFLLNADIAIAEADGMNLLPLNHACMNNINAEIVELLVEAYPEGIQNLDVNQSSPMHLLFSSNDFSKFTQKNVTNMTRIVEILCPFGAASQKYTDGMLPIHYACAFGCPSSVVKCLMDHSPKGNHLVQNSQGRTALHFAMSNASRHYSHDNIKVLIEASPEIVNKVDNRNKIPLHLFYRGIPKNLLSNVPDHQMDKKIEEQMKNIQQCLDNYLEGNPFPTPYFITTLTKLPPWLKDFAVSKDSVKNMLNYKITQRTPTVFLFLDILIYILVMIWLPRASMKYLRYEKIDIRDVALVFLAASYFLIRELMQIVSALYLKSFMKWVTDIGNLQDLLFCSIMMYLGKEFNKGADECVTDSSFTEVEAMVLCKAKLTGVRVLCLLAYLLLYTGILRFIKSVLVEFSVFVNGVLFVLNQLTTFAIFIMMMLMAFSQVFTFLFIAGENCNGEEFFPYCNLGYSMIRNIQGLSGEVDPGPYLNNWSRILFFVLYVFGIIILLVNVLVAIVVDNYDLIKNERASVVFWGNRLDYVAEIDGTVNVFMKLLGQGQAKNMMSVNDTGRESWESLVNVLQAPVPSNFFSSLNQLITKIAVLALMACWIMLGLLSLGTLWPPQIREYILTNSATSNIDLVEEVSMQISELRKEVHDLKSSSRSERRRDRNQLISVREDAEALQKSVLDDMAQIRDIMKTLLEIRRQELGLNL